MDSMSLSVVSSARLTFGVLPVRYRRAFIRAIPELYRLIPRLKKCWRRDTRIILSAWWCLAILCCSVSLILTRFISGLWSYLSIAMIGWWCPTSMAWVSLLMVAWWRRNLILAVVTILIKWAIIRPSPKASWLSGQRYGTGCFGALCMCIATFLRKIRVSACYYRCGIRWITTSKNST